MIPLFSWYMSEEFEDIKEVIRIRNLKEDRQRNVKRTNTKTLHRKLTTKEHKPTKNWGCSQVLGNGKQYLLH